VNDENLIPGPKGSRTAGRELLTAAIAAVLTDEYADDDAVREALGKASDFQVTEAAREALIQVKAGAVYRAIFDNIKKAVIHGGGASIKDFARFKMPVLDDMVEVLMGPSGQAEPIFDPDAVVSVDRTAQVKAGSWLGVNKARYVGLWGPFAHSQDMALVVPAGPFHIRISASDTQGFGHGREFNCLRVTEVGVDTIVREYDVGGLAIEAYGMAERVWLDQPGVTNPDYQVDFVTMPEPGRVLTAGQLEILGSPMMPVRAGEYGLLISRGVDGLYRPEMNARRRHFEAWGMSGVAAESLMPFYPMRGRVLRGPGGVGVAYTYKITRDEFIERFYKRRAELKAAGVWLGRSRNYKPAVRAQFWPALIASLQPAAPPDPEHAG